MYSVFENPQKTLIIISIMSHSLFGFREPIKTLILSLSVAFRDILYFIFGLSSAHKDSEMCISPDSCSRFFPGDCISSVKIRNQDYTALHLIQDHEQVIKNSASSIVGPEKLFICTYMYLETFINIIAFYVFYIFNLIKQSN